ncbi:MAG TPA: TetR family transcriptional regulator [Solirubrobacteraceae bacterium]|nr:TetR family transcriptional regulator [Solirubrobacteraceae bacterium]
MNGETFPAAAAASARDDGGMIDELFDDARIRRVLEDELGEELAAAFLVARETQERWARRRHPDDGLRERKKRRTRQQISDVATTLFVVRGFDNVKVSEIAEIVGVSEKTVYNYFPTKESLVFDRADETVDRLVTALRGRSPGESPTKAVLRALADDMDDLEDLPDELYAFFPLFNEMIAATPALRAAWLDLQSRLVEVATAELAQLADVDPRDPEPMVAARAIVALSDLSFAARIRHIEAGLRGVELRSVVVEDLERAARLLDAGLWSFNLLAQGRRTRGQLREAAIAAEDARRQVQQALKQARAAWHELTRTDRLAERRARSDARERRRDGRRAREDARCMGAELRRDASELGHAARELAQQVAYEALRAKLQERREAIRTRQAAIRARRGAIDEELEADDE